VKCGVICWQSWSWRSTWLSLPTTYATAGRKYTFIP